MSDLGPFAIRRIESRGTPGAPSVPSSTADPPAVSVLERAAEVYARRVTGEVERDSPDDTQIAESLRTQSAAIDAQALTPLLGSLSGPPSLVIPSREHDALAPATSAPRDPNSPSIDPSVAPLAADLRTSVFHPLADLAATPRDAGRDEPGARTRDRQADKPAERLQPLLDKFLPAPTRTRD